MANKINDDFVIGLSSKEAAALTTLLETAEPLDPALVDLNNTMQTL